MNKILALAKEQQAAQVTKVSVKLGALSHMSPSHFKEHFDIAAKGNDRRKCRNRSRRV